MKRATKHECRVVAILSVAAKPLCRIFNSKCVDCVPLVGEVRKPGCKLAREQDKAREQIAANVDGSGKQRCGVAKRYRTYTDRLTCGIDANDEIVSR